MPQEFFEMKTEPNNKGHGGYFGNTQKNDENEQKERISESNNNVVKKEIEILEQ